MASESPSVPRGRHAPPLEVRLERQRARLFDAAAAVFSRVGYAEASAEAISREAGMSKATFYEHFANKEECILALFDAAGRRVSEAVAASTGVDDASAGGASTPEERVLGGVRAFLAAIEAYPDYARTLLVEIIGAGPRATARRDAVLEDFARLIDAQNAVAHERFGAARLASLDDAFAIVGAIVELVSRHLRHRRPDDIRDLEPVIARVVIGVVEQGRP
ncbi:MAG TPA: TetR/AcrR family transcriptional regulator [Solirubrobacteraceae bacterium]|jgi:AcrR family transcriptional regulator|nr:TetR/AcrR family transcriptional regulator [Solirubrobacteraceae bacterium]